MDIRDEAIDYVANIPTHWDADGTPRFFLLDRADAEVVVDALYENGLAIVGAEAVNSKADLGRLRRALVWWGNDVPANHGEMGHGQDMRDTVVAQVEQYGDDRVYHAADEIISLIGRSYDVVDATLHDLIPEGEWGIDIPDNCTVTDFVDGANPQASVD